MGKASPPLTPCDYFTLREYWGGLGPFFGRYGTNLDAASAPICVLTNVSRQWRLTPKRLLGSVSEYVRTRNMDRTPSYHG